MFHPPYTLMVLGFVVVGAALAPAVSWLLLGGALLAYTLGLGLGAHLLDQIPGMGSRYIRHWPDWALWVGGFVSLGGAVAIGVLGAFWYARPLLLPLVAAQTVCAIGYPLAKWFGGLLHRDSVFAVSWGCLPFLTSYYVQTGAINLLSTLVALAFGAVAAVEIRWSRASRELRSQARSPAEGRPATDGLARRSFHYFDRALEALSAGTILVALGLLTSRLVLPMW